MQFTVRVKWEGERAWRSYRHDAKSVDEAIAAAANWSRHGFVAGQVELYRGGKSSTELLAKFERHETIQGSQP